MKFWLNLWVKIGMGWTCYNEWFCFSPIHTLHVQKAAADLAFTQDLVSGEFFPWHQWFNAIYALRVLTFDSKLHLRTFPVQKVAADLAFSRDLVTGEFFLWHWFNAMYQRTTCSTFDSNLETLGALVLQIVPSLAEQLYCTAIYCYDGIF